MPRFQDLSMLKDVVLRAMTERRRDKLRFFAPAKERERPRNAMLHVQRSMKGEMALSESLWMPIWGASHLPLCLTHAIISCRAHAVRLRCKATARLRL